MADAFFKHDLLNHFKSIQPLLERAGAKGQLDPLTFRLRVRLGEKAYELHPQFIKIEEGRKQYTPKFGPEATRFIGWRPYFNKRWELSDEKLKFKAFVREKGFATPEYSADPRASLADVIVKKSVSSFAADIKGPFHSSRECPIDAAAGEFYERFVVGRSAKIFYWDARPVCLEIEKAPVLLGDGRSTLRELIARAGAKKQHVERAEGYLRYVGKTLDTVPAFGQSQQVDFRYGSLLNVPSDMEDIDLTGKRLPELEEQLRTIGEMLWGAIPEPVRRGTVFTVDAVLDEANKLWLTEMNSNPFVHPFVYPAMLEAMFKGDVVQHDKPLQTHDAPPTTQEMLELAAVHFDAGATGAALELWQQVLARQPGHPRALFFSGLALARSARLAEAKAPLEELVKTAPGGNLYLQPAMRVLASIDRDLATSRVAQAKGSNPPWNSLIRQETSHRRVARSTPWSTEAQLLTRRFVGNVHSANGSGGLPGAVEETWSAR